MASIIYGNGVADIRGSINGTTFSRNGNGGYAKNKTTPVNPRSGRQVAQRARLTNVTSTWRALTDAERSAWADFAPTVPYTNRLGITSFYTGQQLFVKTNLTLLSIGEPGLTSPVPFAPFVPVIDTELFAQLSAGVLSLLEIQGTSFLAGYAYIVSASAPVSAGIGATSVTKRVVQIFKPVTTVGVLDIADAYVLLYGSGSEGARILVSVQQVDVATGQSVQVAVVSALIGAE